MHLKLHSRLIGLRCVHAQCHYHTGECLEGSASSRLDMPVEHSTCTNMQGFLTQLQAPNLTAHVDGMTDNRISQEKGQLGCKTRHRANAYHNPTTSKNHGTHRQRDRIVHVTLPLLLSALTSSDDIAFQCIYCFFIKVIKVCALQCLLGLQSVRTCQSSARLLFRWVQIMHCTWFRLNPSKLSACIDTLS